MDALVALGQDRPHPEQPGPLAAQSRLEPGAVLLAGQHEQRHAVALVLHGGVEDRRPLAVGQVDGEPALGARGQLVAQPHVGEGAAHHDLVVAPAGAVGVEVLPGHPVRRSGTRRPASVARMEPAGEMWSVVTLSPSTASTRAPSMSVTGAGLGRHPLEVGGLEHIGRVGVPGEGLALGHRHCSPELVAFEDRGVAGRNSSEVSEARMISATSRSLGHRSERSTGLAVSVGADGVGRQIDVHGAGQGVGDDQGWGGQVVHPHVGVDPSLEVAVAREHRDHRQIVLLDALGEAGQERPRVADAGGAAEPTR